MSKHSEPTTDAIEAAAAYLPHSGDCETRPERDCTCWNPRKALMRAALTEVLPILKADAWDEGYQAGKDVMLALMSPVHTAVETTNPYPRSQP